MEPVSLLEGLGQIELESPDFGVPYGCSFSKNGTRVCLLIRVSLVHGFKAKPRGRPKSTSED